MKRLVLAICLSAAFLLAASSAQAEICYPRGYGYRAYGYAPAVYAVPVYRPVPSGVWHPRSSVYLGHRGYAPRVNANYRGYGYGYGPRYSNYYARPYAAPRVRVTVGF